MGRGRTIGRLAEEAGVHVETVRYYERRGILRQPERPDNGWRVYGDEALRTLRFVKRAQWLGFSLDEIEELLALRGTPGREAAARATERMKKKLEIVEEKLEDLGNVRRALHHLANECDGNEVFEAIHEDRSRH